MFTEESAREFLKQRAANPECEAEHSADAPASRDPAQHEQAQAEAGRRQEEFKAHVASFGGDMEALLASQAQLLHGIFSRAVDDYAGAGDEEGKAKLYSAIALRAQNCCRMTLAAMAKIKKRKAEERHEIEEPAIQKAVYDPMDTGSAQEAGGINSPVAALERSDA